ncbi:MAG: hypothetical protein NW237_04290 [Cyanobacteriota bacterium]|nr:hypothetical protein [Cyanobacteriota bacterium]
MRHKSKGYLNQAMHFFTPELYIQFNSSDAEIADKADEAWEVALQEYQHHLERIRPAMPPQVAKISELGLHDAEVLKLQQEVEILPYSFPLATIINLKQGREILSLIYILYAPTRSYSAKDGWHFSKLRKHWLYDEFDTQSSKGSLFLHRILFSDGSVLEIPFLFVITSSFRLPGEDENEISRQIA